MLRNPWKMMRTILLVGTSLMLSVILSAGAHTHQVAADLARHTGAEQQRAIFTLNEPRLFFRLPPLLFDPALDPRASFASRKLEHSLQSIVPHPGGYMDISQPPVQLPILLPDQSTEQWTEQSPVQLPEQLSAAQLDTPPAPYKSYITTAYYLNVRKESNNKSKIIDVVEKGDILRVARELDNGWLQLYEEGFVHGAYAAPVATETVPASQAQTDAAKQADKAAVNPSTQQLAPPVQTLEFSKPAKPTSKVQSKSGLSPQLIAQILKGTELTDHALEEAILEIEDEYGINAYFTIAVMKLESGNGKSRLAKHKNNLFGLNATGGSNSKAFAFDTKADSVRKFGELIAKAYVGKGYTTIEKVARKYCPANDDWSKLVHRIMKSDHNKLKKLQLV